MKVVIDVDVCKWVIRPGTENTLWAYLPCRKTYNYLSKTSKKEQVKQTYDGKLCPVCNKPVECDVKLLEGV